MQLLWDGCIWCARRASKRPSKVPVTIPEVAEQVSVVSTSTPGFTKNFSEFLQCWKKVVVKFRVSYLCPFEAVANPENMTAFFTRCQFVTKGKTDGCSFTCKVSHSMAPNLCHWLQSKLRLVQSLYTLPKMLGSLWDVRWTIPPSHTNFVVLV